MLQEPHLAVDATELGGRHMSHTVSCYPCKQMATSMLSTLIKTNAFFFTIQLVG